MNLEGPGIYMLLNIINNKCYIGSSKNVSKRIKDHYRELKNNTHCNNHLQSAYNKYGASKFVHIKLESVENIEDLIDREIYWIKLKDSLNAENGYNLGIPAKNNSLIPREETVYKQLLSFYDRFYKNNPKMSLEDFLLGKRYKDIREKIVGPGKGNKKVFAFNKDTGEKITEYGSIYEAAKELNTSESNIRLTLQGTNKSSKGLILVKEEDYNPDVIYKQERKGYTYIKRVKKDIVVKGPYKGKPVETYNLETGKVIEKFNNKHEVAEKYNTTSKYINTVICGGKKSFRGMGLRYTTN